MPEKRRAAIVLNAPELDVKILEKDVICADGGVKHAAGAFIPKIVVGDFDSADEKECAYDTVVCPVIKDYTDGERAVRYAKDNGYDEVVIYGAEGGRSDHVYANLSLLAYAEEIGISAVIRNKTCYVIYVNEKRGRVELNVKKGTTISVAAFGSSATITDSFGFYYPYNALTLTRARAGVGISNVATENKVGFRVEKGEILIFVSDSPS
ncbi:MAG: thiamine diphosphokinase [Christensenellales bacterium]